ncbi:MAG: peptidoglycan-binding domain-containing protein [Clostridia bacterium]|nr:peptidoglycan-binding domain-containing protein [Clostridia bacterium]
MKNFIDHEKLDSEGFKNLKKPGEELFPDSMNSNAVKGVQTFLNKEGFKDGKGEELAVDGVVGANTANAIMGYQRAKGLTVDGIVGDETWNSMYKDKKKKEEAPFGGTEKTDEGIVLPTTPEGPKGDTYTPESERSEDHFTKVVDKWKKLGNPFNGLEKEDDESLHDKVRRRWGNGGKPSRVLSLSRDNTPGIGTSPFSTYKPTGIAFDDYAFSEDESEFSGSNRRTDIPESEYLPEDEIFATEEPELMLMSNTGSGKGTNSNSKAEEKEEELGIIKPGYNAKGEWSEDPDADNYGKDSEVYKILSDLNSRWDSATVGEKAKYYSIAKDVRRLEKEGTPIKYAQDEIMNLLHENAEIAKEYQDNLKSGYSGMMYNLEGGNYFLDSSAFLIGMAYGKWNYKYDDDWRVPYDYFDGNDMSKDNNKNWRPWMYFDGMLISADKLGNMNMAYVGTKMGLPKFVFQNILTEDKDDAFWVQYGIDLAEQGR